jgi:hypothetical protein
LPDQPVSTSVETEPALFNRISKHSTPTNLEPLILNLLNCEQWSYCKRSVSSRPHATTQQQVGEILDAIQTAAPRGRSGACPNGVEPVDRRALPPFDLITEVLEAAVDALAPMLDEAKVEIERHIAGDMPMILADPDLVQRGLINLIENSIKYARSGGLILLSVRAGHHSEAYMTDVRLR